MADADLQKEVEQALAWLKQKSTPKYKASLPRYGIIAAQAYGTSVADIKLLAKQIGRNHDLAEQLWQTGWYEARLLTSFIDDPKLVTPAQMDRWCKDFDNWGICDTVCFHLFDRTPHAYAKVKKWSTAKGEYQKRASFALLASLAGHDKKAPDHHFLEGLALIEAAADDDRNFVKKAVNWALRRIATRNPALRQAALEVAQRLADSSVKSARWNGKDALRAFKKS